MYDRSVDVDDFAIALTSILQDVGTRIDSNLDGMITKTCEHTKDVVKKNSPIKTGKYKRGWTYNTKKQESGVVGEVGNKLKPGLVHLLELGHARTGGGRVKAYPHVDPAAREGEKMLYELANETIDEALHE